jgi:hypothetical protein
MSLPFIIHIYQWLKILKIFFFKIYFIKFIRLIMILIIYNVLHWFFLIRSFQIITIFLTYHYLICCLIDLIILKELFKITYSFCHFLYLLPLILFIVLPNWVLFLSPSMLVEIIELFTIIGICCWMVLFLWLVELQHLLQDDSLLPVFLESVLCRKLSTVMIFSF